METSTGNSDGENNRLIDIEALDRYISGRASSSEFHTLIDTVNGMEALDDIALTFKESVSEGTPVDRKKIWKLVNKMRTETPEIADRDFSTDSSWIGNIRSSKWFIPGIFATIFIGVLAIPGLNFGSLSGLLNRPAALFTSAASGEGTIYITHAGNLSEFTLNDGSKVILNAGSSLQVLPGFGVDERRLRLIGEAYFEVTNQNKIPFIVEAGSVTTRVLGTEFSVKAYEAENARIAVRKGRVAVDRTVLESNEVAWIDIDATSEESLIRVTHEDDIDPLMAFTTGSLVVAGKRLSEVIPELNRWFNVDIQLSDRELGEREILVAIRSTSLEDLRRLLEVPLNVRIEIKGRTVTLFPRNS